MSANLENSAVATGLQKVNFYFNAKEGSSVQFTSVAQSYPTLCVCKYRGHLFLEDWSCPRIWNSSPHSRSTLGPLFQLSGYFSGAETFLMLELEDFCPPTVGASCLGRGHSCWLSGWCAPGLSRVWSCDANWL